MIGECTSYKVVALCEELGWGRMWVRRNIRPLPGERWGFDNGVFADWKANIKRRAEGRSPKPWDADAYRRRIDRADVAGVPHLAVVPDKPAEGMASLEHSLSWVEKMPGHWPLYLAVQDGMSPDGIRPHLGPFAGIFLGGSTRFKTTAPEWLELARDTGRRFHYARVSWFNKFDYADALGVDSCDSTQFLWHAEYLDRIAQRCRDGLKQGDLFV